MMPAIMERVGTGKLSPPVSIRAPKRLAIGERQAACEEYRHHRLLRSRTEAGPDYFGNRFRKTLHGR